MKKEQLKEILKRTTPFLLGAALLFVFFNLVFLVYHFNYKETTFMGPEYLKTLMSAFFGAGAVAAVTGSIVMVQSNAEAKREKSQKIFDEKIELYKNIMIKLCKALDLKEKEKEPQIDATEELEILSYQLQIALLSEPRTFEAFNQLVQSLSDETNKVKIADATKGLIEFSLEARDDLNIHPPMNEADQNRYDAAVKIFEESTEKIGGGYGSRFSSEKANHSKSELSELLVDYWSDKENLQKQKVKSYLEILLREDKSFNRKDIKEILIKEKIWYDHFKQQDYVARGHRTTYEWYVGNQMSHISKVFTRANADAAMLKQIVSWDSVGRTDSSGFEVKAGAAGAKKKSFYIRKEYRSLLEEILND